MLPQMMPLPWIFVFLYIFLSFYSVFFYVSMYSYFIQGFCSIVKIGKSVLPW